MLPSSLSLSLLSQFLDAQRIHNLTTYLQALHESPAARTLVTVDHTTLLLNCYTKLKDIKKLDAFILVCVCACACACVCVCVFVRTPNGETACE